MSLASILLALTLPCVVRPQNQPQNSQSQDQSQKKQDKKKGQQGKGEASAQPNNPPPANEPKPLFGGSVMLKSSRQSKDSATLGFNGLDPNGQVQKSFLASSATASDAAKVQQIARVSVSSDELNAFLQEGNLTQQAAPPSSGENK